MTGTPRATPPASLEGVVEDLASRGYVTVGAPYVLEAGGSIHRLDALMREAQTGHLTCVMLGHGAFAPEMTWRMEAMLEALDDLVRVPAAPTWGLLLCEGIDRPLAALALAGLRGRLTLVDLTLPSREG